jgi:hypothetical protein
MVTNHDQTNHKRPFGTVSGSQMATVTTHCCRSVHPRGVGARAGGPPPRRMPTRTTSPRCSRVSRQPSASLMTNSGVRQETKVSIPRSRRRAKVVAEPVATTWSGHGGEVVCDREHLHVLLDSLLGRVARRPPRRSARSPGDRSNVPRSASALKTNSSMRSIPRGIIERGRGPGIALAT